MVLTDVPGLIQHSIFTCWRDMAKLTPTYSVLEGEILTKSHRSTTHKQGYNRSLDFGIVTSSETIKSL